jgi:diguanylate cyclase (GGDEF)-like protein
MRIEKPSSFGDAFPNRPSLSRIPGASFCARILLLSTLSTALCAQVATRDALERGIRRAQGVSAAKTEGSATRAVEDRNSEIFLGFAQLRNSLGKNQEAVTLNLKRILEATDTLGDETTVSLVYSELANTFSEAENSGALSKLRDHTIQQAPNSADFPYFDVFSSLGRAFRKLHDNRDADLAYEIAGQHLSGQTDKLVAGYYTDHAAALINVGRFDRALDCFQHARAIYRRIGGTPAQFLVDNAELELRLKHYEAAQEFIEQAAQLSTPQDSLRERYSVQETAARILTARKKFDEALEHIRAAQALAPADNFELQHFTFALYHDLYFQSHNYPAMVTNARAMLASAQISGNAWSIGYSKGLLGLALGLNGEVENGIRLIDEAAQENLAHHSTHVDNLEQKYEVYEAAHRYPEALAAYRDYRDAEQEWKQRTNEQNLSHLEASLALEKSEEKRRELLAEQLVERNREEQTRLQNLNLIRQEQLRAIAAERNRRDQQIDALHTQGQLKAAERMRQQLEQEERTQQFQLDYLTRRGELKNWLSVLLLVCLLLVVALAWSLWRANLGRKQQALEDPLTRLKNRRFMMPFMEHETERLRRSGLTALILLADIDHFKDVNDRFGHEAGDETLVQFAEILRRCVRHSDVVSRWGGEEFVVTCPQSGETDLATICNRVRNQLQQTPIVVDGKESFHLTISIGAALFSPSTVDEHWETALARADRALYNVKRNGRDNWALAFADSNRSTEQSATI